MLSRVYDLTVRDPTGRMLSGGPVGFSAAAPGKRVRDLVLGRPLHALAGTRTLRARSGAEAGRVRRPERSCRRWQLLICRFFYEA